MSILSDILEDTVDEKYYLSDEKTEQLLARVSDTSEIKKVIDDQGRLKKQLRLLDTVPTLRANTHGNESKVVEPSLKVARVGNVNPSGNGMNGNVYSDEGLSPTLTTNKGEGAKILRVIDGKKELGYSSQDVYRDTGGTGVKQVGNLVNTDSFGGNPQTGRVYSTDGLSPTLNTMQGGGREPKILTVANTLDTGCQQGVVVPVLTPDRLVKRQNGRRFKENGEPMFTINTQDRHGIYNGLRIRKLTPLECWRLQGFSDELFYKAQAVNSNSQLYKQAGNSVTVNVVYEVAKNLGGKGD